MILDKETKIVLVLGLTGAGKSYLIREISGQDVKVGDDLGSCTQKIEPVRCQISGQSVIILDTPGFDDTNRSDTEVLADVADYLALLYSRNFKVCGIIYLYNIDEIRYRGNAARNLEMFEKLCGEHSFKNVVMLTRGWGSDALPSALKKENTLKNNYWKLYLEAGCRIDRYLDVDDLIRIFDTIIQRSPVVLDIQREMVDEEKPLDRTAAGELLNRDLAKQKKIFDEEIATITRNYHKYTDQMREEMDKSRLEMESALKKLEVERLMLTDSHKRAQDASKAGMQEQYRQLEKEREGENEKYKQRLKEAETEKNGVAREKAELEAILKHHNNQKSLKRKEQEFWGAAVAF
ncbi:hypothetical protein BGX27_002408, partial [Mortierella sp. AM989]